MDDKPKQNKIRKWKIEAMGFKILFIIVLVLFVITSLINMQYEEDLTICKSHNEQFVNEYTNTVKSIQSYYYDCLNHKMLTGTGLGFCVEGYHIDENCLITEVKR